MFLYVFYKGLQINKNITYFPLFIIIRRCINDETANKVITHTYNKKEYEKNVELSKKCKNYIDFKNKIFYEFLPNKNRSVFQKGNKVTKVSPSQENKKKNEKENEIKNEKKNEIENEKEGERKSENSQKENGQEKRQNNLTKQEKHKRYQVVNEQEVPLSVSYESEYKKLEKVVNKQERVNHTNLYVKNTTTYITEDIVQGYDELRTNMDIERNYFTDNSSTKNRDMVYHDISNDLKNICIDNTKHFSNAITEKNEKEIKLKLNQSCAQLGFCSSRFALENIKNGIVNVNGETIYKNIDVDLEKDKIELTKRGKELLQNKITILLNKPPHYLSISADNKAHKKLLVRNLIKNENKYIEEEHKCMSYFIYKKVNIEKVNNLYVCGRLDRSSSGLLIFSQNTLTNHYLLNKYKYQIEKEYIINTYHPITEINLQMLKQNLCVNGKYIYKCNINYIDPYTLQFILYQGFHKIIRKIALASNIKIKSLHRVRIGNVHLKNLPMGKWRFLMPNESFI